MWFVFALGSALFAALTSILAKVGIEGVNSTLATAIRTVVVLAMSWGMVFLTRVQGGMGEISRRSWLFLILSGLATGASWLCYYRALQLGRAFCACQWVVSSAGASGWRHLASISSSGISSVLMTESICSILSQSSAGKRLRTRSMTVCR